MALGKNMTRKSGSRTVLTLLCSWEAEGQTLNLLFPLSIPQEFFHAELRSPGRWICAQWTSAYQKDGNRNSLSIRSMPSSSDKEKLLAMRKLTKAGCLNQTNSSIEFNVCLSNCVSLFSGAVCQEQDGFW